MGTVRCGGSTPDSRESEGHAKLAPAMIEGLPVGIFLLTTRTAATQPDVRQCNTSSHPQQVDGIGLADQDVHQVAAALQVGQAVPGGAACRGATMSGVQRLKHGWPQPDQLSDAPCRRCEEWGASCEAMYAMSHAAILDLHVRALHATQGVSTHTGLATLHHVSVSVSLEPSTAAAVLAACFRLSGTHLPPHRTPRQRAAGCTA